ncbi:kinase-like domain-containing protein, partial [Phycomyces nitens]
MVIDLMLGGDLRFHLERFGIMPEERVRFYAAEISLGLNYLHSKNIVHRDIKPDNILLDDQGHSYLTDFNIAVQYTEGKPLTSIAGSMAYMAPEVLQKRGYYASVDWWSLGVMCYELLFGKRPFRGKSNDMLHRAILYEPLSILEQKDVSPEAVDFVKGLLTRDVDLRLGVNEKGFNALLSHPWFAGLDWEALKSKAAIPPFIPDSKRANFDPTHELEEILMEEYPLKVRRRNPKRSGTGNTGVSIRSQTDSFIEETISPEEQVMEEKFLTYDYTRPMENERRKDDLERKRWAQKMSKTNGEKPGIHTNTRKVAGTYKSSVLEYLNQKPVTPLTAADILKMEDLARSARS